MNYAFPIAIIVIGALLLFASLANIVTSRRKRASEHQVRDRATPRKTPLESALSKQPCKNCRHSTPGPAYPQRFCLFRQEYVDPLDTCVRFQIQAPT